MFSLSAQPPTPPSPLQANPLVQSVNIPPRPALLMALQREMRKDDPHLKKVAQLLGRDVAMAGNLLETANSAFFNQSRRIETVEDAIALIGMNQCGALMTALITRRVLANGGMMMARFWDVSEKRSQAMTYVVKQTRAAPPELAHSFGLFCDIGIPLLKTCFPAYLQTLSIANRTAVRRFVEVEDSRHGVNHTLVGAQLAEKWGIAPDVVQAIRMHHAFEVLYDESTPAITRGLVASNLIVEKVIQSYRGEIVSREWMEGGDAATAALGLSAADVEDLCQALKSHFAGGRRD